MADRDENERPSVKGGEHSHGGHGHESSRESSHESGRDTGRAEISRAMGDIGHKGGEESVKKGMSGASGGRVSAAALQESLKGIDYPAKKQDMARTAESHGASREIVDKINQLPDREYRSAADVSEAFGKVE
jgi:hypothetical protein